MNQPNDIRWHQRLQNFQSAFNELDDAVAKLPPAVEKNGWQTWSKSVTNAGKLELNLDRHELNFNRH